MKVKVRIWLGLAQGVPRPITLELGGSQRAYCTELVSTSNPLQLGMFYFIFVTKKNSPKNDLHLILIFYIKLWKVSPYYYVSTNSITLWILVNLGGSWWWIPIVDPSGSPLWIQVDPGGFLLWIQVDSHCGSR